MPRHTTLKRFTVSLDERDYKALCTLAEEQRPPLSLQYTVRLAIRRFLDQSEGGAITLPSSDSSASRGEQ